jgi:hypothetical protein
VSFQITASRCIAIFIAMASPAAAYCPSHNPLDLRCNTADFANPNFRSVEWYRANKWDRAQTIQMCAHPSPAGPRVPRQWCLAAAQAELGQGGR